MSVLKFRNPNYVAGGTEPEWLALPVGGGIGDAPEDGKQYLRQDGEWSEVVVPEVAPNAELVDPEDAALSECSAGTGFIEDAPEDGRIYGRHNGEWIETGSVLETVTITLVSNQSLPGDLAGAIVTLSNSSSGKAEQQVWNGEPLVFMVEADSECVVSFGEIGGYTTPSQISFTSEINNNRFLTATYNTHVLTVNVVGRGATPSGYVVSVINTDTGETIGTQDESMKIYKIPFGINYKVTASVLDGYNTVTDQAGNSSSKSNSITVTYVHIPVVDLSMFDIYGEAISQTTANCYIVSKPGWYRFPVVYGSAIKDGAANAAAYTRQGSTTTMDFVNYNNEAITSPYIETDTGQTAAGVQLSVADTDSMMTDLEVVSGESCSYVKFNVPSVPSVGANGIISVLDSSGTIMWSWHIWLWPHDLGVKTITNSTGVDYDILPVNLATVLDNEDALSSTAGWKNWFYQWGRPTPVCPPSSYDSTSNHGSYGVRSFSEAASPASDYGVGIRHPETLYGNWDSPYNWFGSICYYNLWDAACTATGSSDNVVVKTVYDPCPIGFHVPNGNTFTGFSTSNVVGGFSNGYTFKRNSSDTTGVFFPASGCRNFATMIYYTSTYGYYVLSSILDRGSAYTMLFNSDEVKPSAGSVYCFSNSVRCVAEKG